LLFGTLFVTGLPGFVERIVHEHANSSFQQTVPWGLWVAAYLMFSGASAGAFPIAALAYVFKQERFRPLAPFALLTALASLSGAMIVVLADLGRPDHAFHLMLRPNLGSVMFWVIALYSMYSVVLLAMLYLALRPRWAARARETGSRLMRLLALGYHETPREVARDARRLRVVGAGGLLVSLTLAAAVGMLFAALSARTFWHSGLFPLTFLVSALASGTALVIVGAALLTRGGSDHRQTLLVLARFVAGLLLLELVILPAEALVVLRGGIPADVMILRAIAVGPHSWVFWVMQLGVGTLGAIALILLPRRLTLASAATGALFALVGTFAFRLNFVIPQLAVTVRDYMPNLYEWNFVVFGTGVAGLVLLVGRRLLPVFPEMPHLESEPPPAPPAAAPTARTDLELAQGPS